MTTEFALVNSEVLSLTPELVKQFAEMEPSPTERVINPSRVKHLREKVEAGHAVTFQWARAQLGDKVYRINGQHSSAMLSELDGNMPADLRVHLDTYKVDSTAGLATLFRQFDDRKSSRTPADIAGAYQGLFPEVQGVERSVAKLGIEGVVWWRRNVEKVPVPSGDDAYTLFGEAALHGFINWMGELFSIKTPEFRRAPLVAAMYATFCASEAEARKFWTEVARGGDQYDETNAATVLDRWLKETKEDPDMARALKAGEFYQGCLFAWNAMREGKAIKDIKHDLRKGFHKPN